MRQLLMSLSFLLPAIAAAYDYPSPPPPPQGETVPLLSFKSSDEANAAFKPFIPGTPEVEMDGDRIVLPINFKGTRHLRVCWDVPFKFDMTPYDRMECDFYIASSAIASRAHIYFHSVNGWYFRHLDELKPNQWNHIVLKRKDLLAESTPEGWHRTDGLRFGIWRDDTFNEDTFAILANFRLMRQKANVAIIRYDNEIINGLNSDSKREFVREKIFSDNVETCLNRIGMTYSYISDFDLDRESLFKHKLIILPYNRRISAEHAALYEEFVAQGGKILAFYALTPPLDKLLGLKGGRNISAPGGRFTGMFSTERGFPPFTRQSSWCYIDLKITDERNKVVATWQDAKGNRTDIPAVVLSPNGAFITHVCLGDGMDAKPKLIMEIISRLVPEVLADCAARMLDNPGLKGADGIDNFEMFQRKFANEQDADLQKACHAALEFHQRAQEQFKLANFPESIACSGAAMDKAMETWARSKRSKPNEVRGIWCHDAPGLPGKTWDESIRIIADAGLNRIYPNMLWAMQAGYPSKVLDSMPGCGTPETDQMRQCLDACHKYGVECHVWKVSWIDIKNNPNITEKIQKRRTSASAPRGKNPLFLQPPLPFRLAQYPAGNRRHAGTRQKLS